MVAKAAMHCLLSMMSSPELQMALEHTLFPETFSEQLHVMYKLQEEFDKWLDARKINCNWHFKENIKVCI